MLSNKSIAAIMLPPMIAGVLALLINWRIHRDMDGVGWWPAGTAVSIVGVVLRSLEGTFPEGVSILLAATLIVGGQLAVLLGLCRFAGQAMLARSAFLVMAWLIVGASYFTWIDPQMVARTFVVTSALAVSLLLQVPALMSLGRQEGFAGVAVLACVYAAALPIFCWRLVVLVTNGTLPPLDIDIESLTQFDQFNQISAFIAASVLVILRTYGYILLATNRVNARLRQTATVDVLTGLPNRRAFDDEMRRIAPRVRRDRIRFGLGVLDLDRFKHINDTHGHAAGDTMLRHFAGVARSVLRDSDFFARVGGEEFVLVIADTNAAAFRQAAERIRQAFAQSRILVAGGDLRATVSAGLAISAPGEFNPQALYARADEALYRAKANGRDRVELAETNSPAVTADPVVENVSPS